MPIGAKAMHVVAALILLGFPLLGGAQTSEATLDGFVSQSVGDVDSLYSATIGEWAIRHPGETVEAPAHKDRDYDPANVREQLDRKLQGRWCLRSTAGIGLAGGIHVRRIALFYQPLVELGYGKPLPPLPTETGDALRKHGCRLGKIFHEFEAVPDTQNFVETIAKQISGERLEEPGKFIMNSENDYWKPVYSFSNHSFYFLFTHHSAINTPKVARPDEQPVVLLGMEWGTLEYGQPSPKTINPEAGQPWLAMRAAMLAQLPEAPTLTMLSFLAPQVGDTYEQAPLHCHRQLVPVLHKWLNLAARIAPEQRAAAIPLADRVLGRLGDCEEFSGYGSSEDKEIEAEDHNALEKDLRELGIETETPARLGNEHYSGNLLDEVLKLAPGGAVNELGQMAILNLRCQWSSGYDSVDCTDLIKKGESFLSRFPEDEWTPSVHLILAEACSRTAAGLDESDSDPENTKTELLKKATAHYRAWYAKSTNERDRALVWQEIWAIEAGMGPWLTMPPDLQQP
jgi:hypothetical protein